MVPVRIQTKFLVLVLGILIVLLSIFSAIIIRRENALLARKNIEQEHLLATILVASLKDDMLAGRARSTVKLMEGMQGTYGLIHLMVLRENGTPAFGAPGDVVTLPEAREAFRTGRIIEITGADRHTNFFPLKNESECRRCHAKAGDVLGVIMISHSLGDSFAELRTNKYQLVLLFSLLIAVIGVAIYIAVQRVVLQPLRQLHTGAEIIGKGDFTRPIVIESRDEFQDLASTFNDMAGMLKETYAGLENMVKVRTAELNESVRLMRGILTSMSSGVALLTSEGLVKLMNRQGAWILGRGHEDLVGRKLAEVAPETAAFMKARVGSYEEISVTTPDRVTVPIGFTSSYYTGSEGEQEGLLIVFQDLTELKMLQSALVDRERFAAMGRVVAGVAHEIRNPLFGISAIGQILERDLQSPEHQELSRALIAETKRLNQLVEELLIYGRPMKLKLEEADLRVLWEEVLDMHREELKKKNITMTGDYAVRHPYALFDPHQIRQVFLNLLRNAMEATPDGGLIAITMLLEDDFILFRVTDTGTGIPKQHLDHVFDLFFTTKPKGTGLGLAICRKIMQDHGGDIAIESEARKGTTVTIKLPFRMVAWPGPRSASGLKV
ncbi:MAG: ATP-binding protein [Nitrospirota bacterium]|nr:ATP-binding protein [Nitrospirota bacterium]